MVIGHSTLAAVVAAVWRPAHLLLPEASQLSLSHTQLPLKLLRSVFHRLEL